jgi:hypothetical protein
VAGAYAFDEVESEDEENEDQVVSPVVASMAAVAASTDGASLFSPKASSCSKARLIFPPA